MTPKMTALRNVLKLIGVALIVGAVTSALLIHVPLPLLGIGASVVMMLFLIHMIYELELSKAEHMQSLKQLKRDLEG